MAAVFRINPTGRIYGVTFLDHEAGIATNGSVLGNELYPAPKEVRQAAEQHAKQRYEQPSHTAESGFGIVDTISDLADTQAYEEQQRQIQRRKKRRWRR